MLDEFRALGGVAENICLRRGPAGRGVFPRDPAKPVCIRTPANLPIAVELVEFENGNLQIKKNAAVGVREARFFDRYEAAFSWGAGGRDDCAAIAEAMDTLPQNIRTLLTIEFMSGKLFAGPASDRIERRFLGSRPVKWQDKPTMMPVVDLVNHGVGGIRYGIGDGVSVEDKFAGELLARYRSVDPFQIFKVWGFVSPEPVAFSLPVLVKLGLLPYWQCDVGFANERATTGCRARLRRNPGHQSRPVSKVSCFSRRAGGRYFRAFAQDMRLPIDGHLVLRWPGDGVTKRYEISSA
jgi:hypothetical protein